MCFLLCSGYSTRLSPQQRIHGFFIGETMNDLIKATPSLTMSSKQIAAVVDKRHDNVKRTIENLANHGVISYPQIEDGEKSANGVVEKLYLVSERDSYVIVAQLCPEYTAKLVDYWMATKNQAPSLPTTYIEALEHLLLAKKSEQQAIAERDHAIATKAQIGSKREATATATASQAVRQANALQAELGRCKDHATIIAVQNITGEPYKWQSLRKWCKDRGIKPIEVVDPRWGIVKSWPAQAWADVYGVDLSLAFVRADR